MVSMVSEVLTTRLLSAWSGYCVNGSPFSLALTACFFTGRLELWCGCLLVWVLGATVSAVVLISNLSSAWSGLWCLWCPRPWSLTYAASGQVFGSMVSEAWALAS